MKEKLYRFMIGRYGNDRMNQFLLIVAFIFMILSAFDLPLCYLLGIAAMGYAFFRMLSRNIYKRQQENFTYLRYENKIRQRWATFKRDMQQRKTHHIYRCPSCKQKIRIPRGRGKVEIRCPKCSTTFIKRS